MAVKRTGLIHSFRLVRNDPIAVSAVLWTASKAEVIRLLEAGIQATGVQISEQAIAECQAAIQATYLTEAGDSKQRQSAIVGSLPGVRLGATPRAVVPIAAPAAVAPAPPPPPPRAPSHTAVAVAPAAAIDQPDATVLVAASRSTEEHQRLRKHFLSTALGGDPTA